VPRPQPPQPPGRAARIGALLRERRGPLPVWGWLALVLVVLLAVAWWRRRANTAAPAAEVVPGDQTPPAVFPINISVIGPAPTATPPLVPPGGGRDDVPGAGTGGILVTVVHRYTAVNPRYDSTISGIWGHYAARTSDRTTAATWQDLWNDPHNAALRTKLRGNPKNLSLGDRVFVPGVRTP
jgi:hypothetical protein